MARYTVEATTVLRKEGDAILIAGPGEFATVQGSSGSYGMTMGADGVFYCRSEQGKACWPLITGKGATPLANGLKGRACKHMRSYMQANGGTPQLATVAQIRATTTVRVKDAPKPETPETPKAEVSKPRKRAIGGGRKKDSDGVKALKEMAKALGYKIALVKID